MSKPKHPRLKALQDEAEHGGRDVHFGDHQPVKRGFFAAQNLLKQGKIYQAERDLERAYVNVDVPSGVEKVERAPQSDP